MIAFLGWMTFIIGGAWLAAALTFALSCLRGGGLETAISSIYFAAVAALCWISFAIWISPITITV